MQYILFQWDSCYGAQYKLLVQALYFFARRTKNSSFPIHTQRHSTQWIYEIKEAQAAILCFKAQKFVIVVQDLYPITLMDAIICRS